MQKRSLLLVLLFAALAPSLFAAGKIRGKVSDKETQDALPADAAPLPIDEGVTTDDQRVEALDHR